MFNCMNPSIFRLHQKPKTPNEAGLPKISTQLADVTAMGFKGDFNNFRYKKKKNDPNMAIMILCIDIINDLNDEGWPVKPGDLGENITLIDLPYDSIKPKQQYQIGAIVIEITLICDPCSTLQVLPYVQKTHLKSFIKTLMKRRGWYAKVVKTGQIRIGDPVKKIS